MRVIPTYLPDTGTELSPALIHRIVDEASVQDISFVVTTDAAIATGTAYTALIPSMQLLADSNPVGVFHSAASFHPNSMYFGIGATTQEMPGWWDQRQGAWPKVTGVSFNAVATGVTYWYSSDGQNWTSSASAVSGLTCASFTSGSQYILAGWPLTIPFGDQTYTADATCKWIANSFVVPSMSGDPRLFTSSWAFLPDAAAAGKGLHSFDPAFINTMSVTETGYTKVCNLGMVDAFVHYSLSTSFSPNDIYALYHSVNALGITLNSRIPISWNGGNTSNVTASFLPYGLIRKVFTSSGVTLFTMPRESTAYSLGPQPFYVARIWFWGQPCL